MQYGELNEPSYERPQGLRATQKWSIVAAIFAIFLEVVAMFAFVPLAHHDINGPHKTFGIVGLVFAVTGIIASCLLMAPACMSDPQVAYNWRVLSFPFIIFHAINVPFDITFFTIFVFVRLSGANQVAVAGAVLVLSIDIALSVVLIAIAVHMTKQIKMQGQTLLRASDTGKPDPGIKATLFGIRRVTAV